MDCAYTDSDADTTLMANNYDACSFSTWACPGCGLEVLKRLRAGTPSCGVDSHRHGWHRGRVKNLDLGADDYMTKPFELPELEARVRALTRRSSGTSRSGDRRALSYDQVRRVAHLAGQPLELSAREIGLLEILLSGPITLVSKDQLVDHLCGWGEKG